MMKQGKNLESEYIVGPVRAHIIGLPGGLTGLTQLAFRQKWTNSLKSVTRRRKRGREGEEEEEVGEEEG